MVDSNRGRHDGKSQGENAHSNHIAWRLATNRLAASNCQVGNKKYDVRDDVDDETIITWASEKKEETGYK